MFLLLRWFGTRSTSHEIYQEKEEKMEATKMAQKWQESDPKITKRTRKWHKNDSRVTQNWLESDTQMTGGTCREGCGPCGGSRGGPEEQGKHLHWKTLGKHWKTFGNAPTPGQVPISHLSKCTRYLLYLCRPIEMVVYFLCCSRSS